MGENVSIEKTKARVWELIAQEKQGTLSVEEKKELDHYAEVEHLGRLAKAQARKNRNSTS